MNLKLFFGIVSILSITLSSTLVLASRLRLRPLSSAEVYRILKDAGREDAVPEGRIVTQGIAAISGFALGIKSGIAIPLAIGVATSNVTQQFLSNINYTAITASLPTIPPITLPTFNVTAITSNLPTINMTALTSLFKPTTSNTASIQYTTQEICFNSRSLNEIDDSDGDGDGDSEESDDVIAAGRQATATTTTGTGTTGNTPTTTTATSPTTTGTGGVTTTDNGDGTFTNTETTTETGTGGSVNCIVIQKPIVG